MTQPLDPETASQLWAPVQEILNRLADHDAYPSGSKARMEQYAALEDATAALAPYFIGGAA